MVNVTKKFMQQLYDDQRNYLVRVVINLADTNQTVLTLNNENIWGFSPTVEDAVSADEELQIGTAIINKFSFTINNIYGTYSAYDFKNAKVFLTVGLDVGNDTVERIKKGTFYVNTADYNDTFIALECLDGMHKLEKPYKTSAVTFPATADYVVQNICTACGVINDTPNFPNKSFILSNAPDKDTCTYREVLSWVAQICGCFARFNSEGHLELKWYDRQSLEDIMDGLDGGVFDSVSQSRYTTGDTADGGTFNPWNTGYEFDAGDFDDMIKDVHLINSAYSQSMSVDDVVITGVRILVKTKDTDNTDVIASHVTGTEGYVIEISENPFITEANVATILSYLGTQLVGLTFRKANLSIPSDPSFEAGDVAIYFDKNGNYHPILVSRTTFITGDAQTIISSAQTPARNSAERYSAETKNYVATQKQIRAEKSARETMYDDLQDQMANMSGLYYTEVEDPQTHAVTVYYHNKQDLEESDIQIVISDVGITVTDDGGDNWYGLTVDGNLIASILSVNGVNAGWINTGALSVKEIISGTEIELLRIDATTGAIVAKDNQGNIIFSIDANTRDMTLIPTTLTLTSANQTTIDNMITSKGYQTAQQVSNSIEEAIDELNFDSDNLLIDPIGLSTDYWTIHGTLTRNQTDPKSGTDAVKLTPASDEGYIQAKPSNNMPFKVLGATYRFSVWLKRTAASTPGNITMYFNGESVGNIIPTTEWKEYVFEKQIDTISTTMVNDLITIGGMSSFTSSDGYNLYVYNPRVTYTDSIAVMFENLFGKSDGFYITNSGRIYLGATAISVSDLYTLQATIGGFTIDETSIRSGSATSISSGAIALSTADFTRNINSADVTGLRFAIGSSFGVKNTGALYAYSGKIGGWEIYNSDLRSNSLIISSINLQRTIQGTSTSDCRVIMGSDFCIRSNGGIVCGGVTATGLYVGTANDNKQWRITGSEMSFESVTVGTPTVYFSVGSTGNVYTRGNLSVTGTKSIIAETEDYGEQAYYCYETPTPMLGDIGSGVLDETGMCVVALDDIFAESVSTDIQYQVFLQKCGNGDLWVELKDNAYFVVRGTPNLAFDWEVKAKQRRYNQVRYNNDEQIVSDYYPENFTNIYSDENDTEQKQQEEFENIMLNDALSGEEQNILEYLLYDCF